MSSPYPNQRHINDQYDVVGFISSGTYGRVYKATGKSSRTGQSTPAPPPKGAKSEAFAIKK